jgi:hypothetical protein
VQNVVESPPLYPCATLSKQESDDRHHDISHNDLARLNERWRCSRARIILKSGPNAAAAATLIERVAGDVLQYARTTPTSWRRSRARPTPRALRDRARLGRVLEHLARLVGRWP